MNKFRVAYVFVILGLVLFNELCFSTWALSAEGMASYYTVASCQREGTSGVYTATGERYDEGALTCALRRRDFGKAYLVCGPGGCVEVRHNDYGPGRGPTRKGVIVDLTPAAFKKIGGNLKSGLVSVSVQPVVEG